MPRALGIGISPNFGASAGAATRLLSDRSNGFSIDLTQATDKVVEVKDQTTPANNYLGSFNAYTGGTGTFPTTRLCMQQDGSLRYNAHNSILQSADYNTTWTRSNCTSTAGQVGPDGVTTDASLITTSGVSAYISQAVTGLANDNRMLAFVAKKGTSDWCYLYMSDGAAFKRAWFNLATGQVGTVESGMTATISALDDNGNAYASGWYYIAVSCVVAATSSNLRIYPASADNTATGISGRTIYVSRAQTHRGVKRLDYLATTTTARRREPYDWTSGEKLIRYEIAANYRARASDDMTNATYWTLTNATAALNATGPHGEPCSTLTMTANNGTVTQAVTSAGTSQIFIAYVRRKTGTGTLSMTVNGGTNWTDVTSSIGTAGGVYKLVCLRGSLANPTIGFRGGTSGDEFEIALCNVCDKAHAPPPNPNKLIDFALSSDTCVFPFTAYPSAAYMTYYLDFYLQPNSSTTAASSFGFYGATTVKSVVTHETVASRFSHRWNEGGADIIEEFGDANTTGRVQIQHVYGANDTASCVNGSVAWWNHIPNSVTLTSFQMAHSQSVWLRRLVIVPEKVSFDNDDLRTFKLDKTAPAVNTGILASAFVQKVVPDSTAILRIPALEVLSVSGDNCDFITFNGQRQTTGWNLEKPQRMMQRKWRFNRATNILTALTDSTVIYTPPDWDTAQNGVQGYTPIMMTTGPYTGRLLLVYMETDTPGGTPDERNMYVKISDDQGTTWSTGVKILDIADFGLTEGYVATGENSTGFQLQSGTHAGRVYISLNKNNQQHYAMWTDDFKTGGDGTGTTWSRSTTPVQYDFTPLGNLTEPAITYWPNGTIVMVFRNSGGGDSAFATSTDWGVTFSAATLVGGDNTSWNVNCGLIQSDPDGLINATYGRLIYARSTVNGRLGHKIQSCTDSALTMGNNYRLFSENRFIGYCPLRKAFPDDTIYLCMAETQPTVSSNINTSQMIVVFRYDP